MRRRRDRDEARLVKRGRVWWTWYYVDGKRVRTSTGCRDREAAIEVAKNLERAVANPRATAEATATLGDAIALYLDSKRKLVERKKRSGESIEFFETKIGHLRRVLEREPMGNPSGELCPLRLEHLAPTHIDRYIAFRESEPGAKRDSNISPHTIKKELTALRQALELAEREGIYSGNIARLFPKEFTAEYDPRDRALDRDEVTRLIHAFLPADRKFVRPTATSTDRAARVAFLIATAARWSGSERALVTDVAEDLSFVHLRETKTDSADRRVPIVTEDQRALLKFALKNACGTGGCLFRQWDSVNRDFVNACDRAKIERCSPNDLRRTMATWMRAAGITKDVVAMVLGHTTSQMVERVYAKLKHHQIRRLMESQLSLSGCVTIVPDAQDSAALGGLGGQDLLSQVLEIQSKPLKAGGV